MKYITKILLLTLAASAVFFFLRKKADNRDTVRLATTTSVQDTGLLDALADAFQENSRYKLLPVAVGSGQAMRLGKTGEADILWVHSPEEEEQFVAEGFGVKRTAFVHNDFVILGPPADPAEIKGIVKAADAFRKIAVSGALFVSRGDDSGTHRKEKKLWKIAGAVPAKGNYMEAGQGMAGTVTIAGEKNAYCLADRATWLSLGKSTGLALLCEGDGALLNRYSLILVNPGRFPKVNAEGAKAFFDFLLSKRAKDIVEKFGAEKYGQQLFYYDHIIRY